MTGDRITLRVMKQLSIDRLTRPRRPLRTVLIAAGAAVVFAGAGVGAAVAAPVVFPQPTPTPTAVFVPAAQTGSVNRAPAVTDAQEQQAMAQVDKMAAEKAAADATAAKAAADAAAQQAAQQKNASKATTTNGGLPAGAVVPSIPGTTSPDTTKCASGTASDNANGVAICD